MTGEPTDKRPQGERQPPARTRRGVRREPTVLDLKAESVAAGAPGDPGPEVRSMEVASDSLAAETLAGPAYPPMGSVPTTGGRLGDAVPPPVEVTATGEPEIVREAPAPETSPLHDPLAPEASAPEAPARELAGESLAPDPAPEPEPLPDPVVTSVPPVGPAIRTPRVSLLGPVLAGLAAGFIGAGLLTAGFLVIGPAGDIGERLAGLENGLGERASRRTVETLEKRVGGLDGTASALRGDLDALSKKVQEIPSADLPALYGRVDRVERNLADLAAQPKPVEGQAAAPAPQPPPLVAARESAVLAIALLLRDDLDRGLPYARELDALQSAGVPALTIEALRPFAAAGAPGSAALARDFSGISARIANPPPPPPKSVSDRVSATFSGLFTVRPVGEAEGDSPAALAARAEALLQRGALQDAAAALDRIPAADAAPAADFRERLKARIAASDAAAAILSKAVDELLAAARLQGTSR